MGNARTGVRDSQRSKVYKAEHVVHGADFETVEEIQTYVDKVLSRAWFVRRWPRVAANGITVEDGRGRRAAAAKTRWGRLIVTMPKWSRYEEIILHEIAHHCSDAQHGTREVAAHGWEFAGTLVELVRYEMGKDEADEMKASFRKHKVRWTEPTKRKPLSEAQRAANIERLAKARAAREASKPVRTLVWQQTTMQRGYGRPYRTFDGSRIVLIGAKTKKAAAEVMGAEYAEFVKDSEWIDGAAYTEGVRNHAEGIAEGEVRRIVQRSTDAVNENGHSIREWVLMKQADDGLDSLRDLLVI